MVDHIVPINKGGAKLDIGNLQSLCNLCHNRKSGREAHGMRWGRSGDTDKKKPISIAYDINH